jgi:hypothetical protein
MSRLSKKLRDADSLFDKYQSSFGGKYSPNSPNYSEDSKFSLEDTLKKIKESQKRLGILFIVCFIVSLFLLCKLNPSFIMKKRSNLLESDIYKSNISDTKDKFALIKYSLLFALILWCTIFGLSYKFPLIKRCILGDEECNLCKD